MVGPLSGLLLTLFGCGEPVEQEPGQAVDGLGWIETVARDPGAFSVLMQGTGREGWVQLHAHDDARATATFAADEGLRARPALKVAMLEQDLAQLSAVAHNKLFTAWEARGELPPGAAAIAAWSAWCEEGSADGWLAKVDRTDPGAELAAMLQTPPAQWPAPATPLAERLSAHFAALNGDPAAAWDRVEVPVITVGGEVSRTWYDPCFHRVASGHAARVAVPSGWPAAGSGWTQAELGGLLFAPWLTAEDLATDLEQQATPGVWGAQSASRSGLADPLVGSVDDAQLAREQARILADRLQAALKALEADIDDDGKALLVDLRLGEHWRQQWHVAQARSALAQGHPRQALAYAELGTDFSTDPGPGNPPALFAVRALALVQLGRTREALDALHALDDHRGVRQLAEILGDLAVLEGLDRAGDSKEN